MISTPTHRLVMLVFDLMEKTIFINSITSAGTQHTLTTDNTLWLVKDKTVTIGADQYEVVSVVPNVSIVVKHPTATPADLSFEIDLPEFRYGAPQEVDGEITQDTRDEWEKLPLVWLRGRVRSDFPRNASSAIERVSDCEFHFLSKTEFNDYNIEDHSNNSMQVSLNMAESFIKALEANPRYANTTDYNLNLEEVQNWGSYEEKKGSVRQIFSMNIDGVIVKIPISFTKQACKCCEENEN